MDKILTEFNRLRDELIETRRKQIEECNRVEQDRDQALSDWLTELLNKHFAQPKPPKPLHPLFQQTLTKLEAQHTKNVKTVEAAWPDITDLLSRLMPSIAAPEIVQTTESLKLFWPATVTAEYKPQVILELNEFYWLWQYHENLSVMDASPGVSNGDNRLTKGFFERGQKPSELLWDFLAQYHPYQPPV